MSSPSARPATKAVIPVAGVGTRFVPAPTATPKELLPVVDRPALAYIVDEAARAGLPEVLMVTGRNKGAIEDYFDRHPELETALEKKGDALIDARDHLLEQMLAVQAEHGGSVIALLDVGRENIDKYGAVAVEQRTQTGEGDEVVTITGLVEKPPIEEAPSSLAIIGRYVLAPEIFGVLRETAPGRGDEIQLTDALATLVERGQPVHGVVFSGRRYDTGDRLDYLKAVVRLASESDDLGPPLRAWLRDFVDGLPAEG